MGGASARSGSGELEGRGLEEIPGDVGVASLLGPFPKMGASMPEPESSSLSTHCSKRGEGEATLAPVLLLESPRATCGAG